MGGGKKEVLIVTPFYRPNIGGVETRLDELVKSLSRRGVGVTVLTLQPLTTPGVLGKSMEEWGNVRIIRRIWVGKDLFHKFLRYPIIEFLYLVPVQIISMFLFMLFSKNRPKVVHAAGLNAAASCAILKSLFKYRLVVSTHALYNFSSVFFAKITHFFLSKADHILVIGKKAKQNLENIGVENTRMSIQPTWVNLKVFKPLGKNKCKTKLKIKDKFVFGYVGRTNKNKGFKIILKLIEKFESEPRVFFLIIGPGDMSEKLEFLSKKTKNFRYVKKIDSYEVPKYLNSMDVFISFPQYEEGFSRSLVEAISCGVPVLSVDRGCIREIVKPGLGWLVKDDFNSIVSKMNMLLKIDSKIYKKMSDKCFIYSRKNYDERGVEKFIKVYFN